MNNTRTRVVLLTRRSFTKICWFRLSMLQTFVITTSTFTLGNKKIFEISRGWMFTKLPVGLVICGLVLCFLPEIMKRDPRNKIL